MVVSSSSDDDGLAVPPSPRAMTPSPPARGHDNYARHYSSDTCSSSSGGVGNDSSGDHYSP
jgi:hypothetical protein